MNLSPAVLSRVEDLVAERIRAAQDAEDASKGQRLNPGDTEIARADAEGGIDDQIADEAGAPVATLMLRVSAVEAQLEQIHAGFLQDAIMAGDPLTPRQEVALAEVLKEVFAVSSAGDSRIAGFDSETGLADPDRRALAKAARILSSSQSEAFSRRLAATTARYNDAGN
jgi:hypothetical protein